jgi:hypothetical protein
MPTTGRLSGLLWGTPRHTLSPRPQAGFLSRVGRGAKLVRRVSAGREGGKHRDVLLLKLVLLANTENSALISTNEFCGSDLDQGGFTATPCKDQISFHHFRINQEHRLVPE